jgi:hypothetical protein
MENRMRIQLPLITVLLLFSISYAEKQFQVKIGPTWPSALWYTEKPTAWDASLQLGSVFDDKVAIGGAIDFLWNKDAKEHKVNSYVSQVDVLQRTLMFPVTAYLSITPAPNLFVQPCMSGYIGLNTMYFSYKRDSTSYINQQPDSIFSIDGNGWYMGLIWKIAADGVVKMGDNSGLFVGVEYQWSKPRKLGNNDGNLYIRRNMSGVGIRMGIKVSY